MSNIRVELRYDWPSGTSSRSKNAPSLEMSFVCLHTHNLLVVDFIDFFASHLFVASTVRYRPVASVTESSCKRSARRVDVL